MANIVPFGPPPAVTHALEWWHQNEHKIVLAGMVLGGLTFVGFMWALTKAAPIAIKIAAASKQGVAAQAVLAKYGLTAAAAAV